MERDEAEAGKLNGEGGNREKPCWGKKNDRDIRRSAFPAAQVGGDPCPFCSTLQQLDTTWHGPRRASALVLQRMAETNAQMIRE